MLKPRWLGLLGVLVVLLVAFTFLGLWQLSVARDDAQREAVAAAPLQAPVPLDDGAHPALAVPRGGVGPPRDDDRDLRRRAGRCSSPDVVWTA